MYYSGNEEREKLLYYIIYKMGRAQMNEKLSNEHGIYVCNVYV